MDASDKDTIKVPENILVKRNVKDSVFTHLFSDPRYLLELYRALYPGDTTTTVDDLKDVTIKTVLVNTIYNDLAFRASDSIIVLVEAQSTWSNNIVLRELLYLLETL